jgi:hypothetical protein
MRRRETGQENNALKPFNAGILNLSHRNDPGDRRYAMRSLPAPESDRLEEHILICSACRDWLTATDEYVAAMKAAATKVRKGAASSTVVMFAGNI